MPTDITPELAAGRTVASLAEPLLGPASFALHADDRKAIEHETHQYEDPRAASIEALKIVQKRHGWLPDGAIPAIGSVLGIPASDIEGVATFYNLIYRRPVGRHVIKVCDSVACFLTGYAEVKGAFCRYLSIGLGETTADGRFTLLPTCCLGACDKGPVLMIDEDTHGDIEPDGIEQLLKGYP